MPLQGYGMYALQERSTHLGLLQGISQRPAVVDNCQAVQHQCPTRLVRFGEVGQHQHAAPVCR